MNPEIKQIKGNTEGKIELGLFRTSNVHFWVIFVNFFCMKSVLVPFDSITEPRYHDKSIWSIKLQTKSVVHTTTTKRTMVSKPTTVVFLVFVEHFKHLCGKLCGKATHVFRDRKSATRLFLTVSVAEYALSRVCEFLHVHTKLGKLQP